MKLSETIKKVIALAEAIYNYWEVELPKRYRDYPYVHEGEDDGPPPPEMKKLKSLLARLPDEAVYQLALVMYVGLGLFRTDNLARDYAQTKERMGTVQEAIGLMADKPSLGYYLTEGLERLKKSEIDVDCLPIVLVNSESRNGRSGGIGRISRPAK